MAESQYKKALILPPLKGLNMHDNPLQLTSDFATELVNFMPPTTQLELRPAIEELITIPGSVRTMVPYVIGSRFKYKEHWYQKSLNYPAYEQLLVFMVDISNVSKFYILNPISKSLTYGGQTTGITYSDDWSYYKSSVFIMMGLNTGSPYAYSGSKGLKRMAWKVGTSISVGDLENIVTYNGWVFCNIKNSLSIYYCDADHVDPDKTANWDRKLNFFTPTTQGQIEIATVAKRGGSVYKMFTLSAQTNNSVNMYFCVLTTNGELLVYQGESPDTTDTWKIIGIFDVPTPLNRRCFCQMEGDMIIATMNGFVSLQRLIFKQKTEITEALEWRLSKLFTQYEFNIDAFREHFFLSYHRNRRLLIFNVPSDMPMALSEIKRGYVFEAPKSLVFAFQSTGDSTFGYDAVILQYIFGYIWVYMLDYTVDYIFNQSPSDKLTIEFKTIYTGSSSLPSVATTIKFYLVRNGITVNLLNTWTVTASDLTDPSTAVYSLPTWNESVLAKDGELRYDFPEGYTYTVTEIIPKSQSFGNFFVTADLSLILRERSRAKMLVQNIYYEANLTGLVELFDLEYYLKEEYTNIDAWPEYIGAPYNFTYRIATNAMFYGNQFVGTTTENGGFEATLGMQNTAETTREEYIWLKLTSNISSTLISSTEIAFSYQNYLNMTTLYGTDTKYVEFWRVQGDFRIIKDGNLWALDKTTHPPHSSVLVVPDTTSILYPTTNWAIDGTNPEFGIVKKNATGKIAQYIIGEVPTGAFTYTYANRLTANDWRWGGWAFNVVKTDFSVSDDTTNPSYYMSMDNTNADISSVPILNNTQVRSNYKSTQYVFDSHYGTWSSWKDINMTSSVEYNGDFYFVIDKAITLGSNVSLKSTLCKFNNEFFGDRNATGIEASYMSGHIDLQSPDVQKQFTNAKIFGTASTFWEASSLIGEDTYPFTFMFDTDFKENDPVVYQHRNSGLTLPEGIKRIKSIQEFSWKELKDYLKLYDIESQFIESIELPMVSNPATRVAVGLKMKVKEHGIIVYGYELYFKPLNP